VNSTHEWLHFFEGLASLHCSMYLHPIWNRLYPSHQRDIWDSLGTFLYGYAFERQGARPDYAPATRDALLEYKSAHNACLSHQAIEGVYDIFRSKLHGSKLNKNNNPLNPDGSIIRWVVEQDLANKGLTLTTYLQGKIKDNNLNNAFNTLTSIRGIGPKIASLYLRDLVVSMDIDVSHVCDRYLLQPIDVWVWRLVPRLSRKDDPTDFEIAHWIVDQSKDTGVNPEQVSMGIWFFSATIARSEYELFNALDNTDYAIKLVEEFVAAIKECASE